MIIKLLSLNPDTAWTGRTRREGPSSDTDPLVADAFYNAKYSHLCRLPDTVLLRIMERLDPIGLQCLRRTSRLFLRLFGDDRFSHYHHDDDDDDLTRQGCADHTGPGPPVFFPWVRSRRVLECRYPQTPGTRPLGQLLQQDIRICATCRENREARQAWHRALCIKRTSDTALRRCAPCDVHHPPAYFSRLRRCLGRLGHVRLCEHDGCVITWDTALKYGKQLVKCDLPEPARVRLLVCRDKSHLPTRHLHQQQAADGDEAGYYPSITITGSKSTAIRLCMEWTGCLPLRLATRDEEDEKSLVTPGEMARLLKRFRHGSPAEFIVPQSTLGSLPEMRCFDPNRCRCLHYAGKDDTPKGWLLGPRQRRSQNQACRFSSDSDGKLGVAMVSGTHTSRCTIGRDSEMRIDIGPSTTHAASARGRLPLCLGITYRRSILVAAKGDECRAVTQSWYEAIDSRSYAGVALDGSERRPFDVLACPHDDPDCANYHRYSERPVMRECCVEGEQVIRHARGRDMDDTREKRKKVNKKKEKPEKEEEKVEISQGWGRFWVFAMASGAGDAKGAALRAAFVIVFASVLLCYFPYPLASRFLGILGRRVA